MSIEAMKLALEALEGSIDSQRWELDDHITKYGEWYRPQRVEHMKKDLAKTEEAIVSLRTFIEQAEKEKNT